MNQQDIVDQLAKTGTVLSTAAPSLEDAAKLMLVLADQVKSLQVAAAPVAIDPLPAPVPAPAPVPGTPTATNPIGYHFGANTPHFTFGAGNIPGRANFDFAVPTDEDLADLKAEGVEFLRVGYLWGRMQPALGGPLDPAHVALIQDFIARAKAHGLVVILECHSFGGHELFGNTNDPANGNKVTAAHLADLSAKVASTFDIIAIGIMNEPVGDKNWEESARESFTSVRAVKPKMPIIIGGNNWGGPGSYFDPEFLATQGVVSDCHLYSDPNNTGTNSADVDGTTETSMVDRLRGRVEAAKAAGQLTFLGEAGFLGTPLGLREGAALKAYVKSEGIAVAWWAAMPSKGFGLNAYSISRRPDPNNPTKTIRSPQMTVLSDISPAPDVSPLVVFDESSGTKIAAEDASFTMPADGTVYYGASGRFFSKVFKAGDTFVASNNTFGDPAYGVVKAAYVTKAVPVPVVVPPSTGKASPDKSSMQKFHGSDTVTGGPVNDANGDTWSLGNEGGGWDGNFQILKNGQPVNDSGYQPFTGWASTLTVVQGVIYSFDAGHNRQWRVWTGIDSTPYPFDDPRVSFMPVTNTRTGLQVAHIDAAISQAAAGDTLTVSPGKRGEAMAIGFPLTVTGVDGQEWALEGNFYDGGDQGMVYVNNGLYKGPDPMLVVLEGGSAFGYLDINDHRAGLYPVADDRTGFGLDLRLKKMKFGEHFNGMLGGQHMARKSRVQMDECYFTHCGTGDGLTHNIYCSAVEEFRFSNSRSDNTAGVGHLLKSRARRTVIHDSHLISGDSHASCPADFCHGGDVEILRSVLTHGPYTDQQYNMIRYGEEGPARYTDYDDPTGYKDQFVFRQNLLINFYNNSYANPLIALELDAKMQKAGYPDRVGLVDISDNDFVGYQADKLLALYPNNRVWTLDDIEECTDPMGMLTYRLKNGGKGAQPTATPPSTDPVVPPVTDTPTTTPTTATTVASMGPLIILPPKTLANLPAYTKGQQIGQYVSAGTDSMSALEQRSLGLGERGLSDATHYIFAVYGFGTITDIDEIIGDRWGGHNGGDYNGGIRVNLRADSPMFEYTVLAALKADRNRNVASGWNRDLSGASHHPYYCPHFDPYRRAHVHVGMNVVASDPAIGANVCTSMLIDAKTWDAPGFYPDPPIVIENDAPQATDPRDGSRYVLGHRQLARLRSKERTWDVVDLEGTGWDANVGVLCIDVRRNRLVTIHNDEHDEDFCYRDMANPAKLNRLTMTGPAAWAWGKNKFAAIFVQHPTDKAQDAIYLKGPYPSGGVVYRITKLDSLTWYAEEFATTGGDDLCQDNDQYLYAAHLLPCFNGTFAATLPSYYAAPKVLRLL